jgi:hypothetical protein
MSIDLKKCKVGDKLRIRIAGEIGAELNDRITDIVTYIGLVGNQGFGLLFPHQIEYSDGSHGTRTDDGSVYIKTKRPDDLDVLEVL